MHKKHLAEKAAEDKKKRMELKQRKEAEYKKRAAAVYEVKDDAAATLQKEIDDEKYVLIHSIFHLATMILPWLKRT